MNITKKMLVAAAGLLLFAGVTAGCAGSSDKAKDRDAAQSNATSQGPTLEQTNLEMKRKLEENPNAIGYVYVLSFGKPLGYYVTKGKISSNGSQKGPMDDVVRYCRSGDCAWVAVDSKQDDGSYGTPDPGIFFFLPDGTKVVTDLDYIHSTQPLTLNVPKLG